MSHIIEIQIGELLLWRGNEKAAQVGYENNRPVFIEHTPDTYQEAANLLESIALQLWASHAAGDSNLTLYEAHPSPAFAHIKRVLAQTRQTLGRQIVDRRAFSEYLAQLHVLAHTRFSLLASSGLETLAQYNAQPSVRMREKIEYLFLPHIPTGWVRGEDMQILETLCIQGGKVGIIPIVLRDASAEKQDQREIGRNPLHTFWQTVAQQGFGFDWSHESPIPVNQRPEYWRLFPRYGFAIGVPDVRRAEWSQQLIDQVKEKKKSSQHFNFLDVPIGHAGNLEVHFQMGESSGIYNALLGGTVGSGKSTIVHNVLLHACEQYTPEQFRLWIVDFSGLGFAMYRGLAHVDFLHTELHVDAILLDALQQFEMFWEKRIHIFRQAGVDNIADYNQQSGKTMPRCLLVVDEAHNLFGDRAGRQLVGKIAREGRKFGLHLVLITPSFQELPFDDNVKEQIQLRIGCKLNSEAASRNLFGFGNEAAAHLVNTDEIRSAIVNRDAGRPQANQTVHLYNLPAAERIARLKQLVQKYPDLPSSNYAQPIAPMPQVESTASSKADGTNLHNEIPDWLK